MPLEDLSSAIVPFNYLNITPTSFEHHSISKKHLNIT
uniref:Uncharacterized protein n=1 Tax=Tetranychus urticae TaxID=32264 RepID=T1L5B9_TETUR